MTARFYSTDVSAEQRSITQQLQAEASATQVDQPINCGFRAVEEFGIRADDGRQGRANRVQTVEIDE